MRTCVIVPAEISRRDRGIEWRQRRNPKVLLAEQSVDGAGRYFREKLSDRIGPLIGIPPVMYTGRGALNAISM